MCMCTLPLYRCVKCTRLCVYGVRVRVRGCMSFAYHFTLKGCTKSNPFSLNAVVACNVIAFCRERMCVWLVTVCGVGFCAKSSLMFVSFRRLNCVCATPHPPHTHHTHTTSHPHMDALLGAYGDSSDEETRYFTLVTRAWALELRVCARVYAVVRVCAVVRVVHVCVR